MPVRSQLPDGRVRQIRNIQVDAVNDLGCLLSAQFLGQRLLPSGPINAYAAMLQLDATDADFVIFTSWLSPIVRGQIHWRGQGTLREHVLIALGCGPDVSNEHVQGLLLSKCSWAMPICSHHLPTEHWVLMELQLDKRRIVLRDSIIGSGADEWAPQLFVKIVDAIHREFAMAPFRAAAFTNMTVSPAKMDAQRDGWSCGLFVLMGMQAIARKTEEHVKDSEKRLMASAVLERLLQLPYSASINHAEIDTSTQKSAALSVNDPGRLQSDEPEHIPLSEGEESEIDEVGGQGTTSLVSSDVDSLGFATSDDLQAAQQSHQRSWFTVDWSRKREAPESSSDDDQEHDADSGAEASKSRRSAAASGFRARKKTAPVRESNLRSDDRLTVLSPYEVTCKGCKKTIKLDQRRLYIIENYEKHAKRCAGITGTHNPKRAKTMAKSKPPAPNRTITSMFRAPPVAAPFVPAGPSPVAAPTICPHLHGGPYDEYVRRTRTRNFGGVGPVQRFSFARTLFPYKQFPATRRHPATNPDGRILVPDSGNDAVAIEDFTKRELRLLDTHCAAHSRWEVDPANGCIKSKTCSGLSVTPAGLSEACDALRSDQGLLKSIARKKNESKLPDDEQHRIHMQREKYTSATASGPDARRLKAQLDDPVIFSLLQRLEKGESTECFLKLYELSRQGKLNNFSTFKNMCGALADQVVRATSDKSKQKHGIRYSREYLDFMILCRSHGSNSARQYAILTSQTGGPCLRTMRALVAKSDDALQNPELILENVARVKRLADALRWSGPVTAAGDCTKVRPRLAYSHRYGGHILGSVLPINDCEVENPSDIDRVIDKIKSSKSMASQCRAILIQIPDPRAKPIVVALIAVNGKDDAERIYELHMRLQSFCAHVGLPLLAVAADGAASEMKAMKLLVETVTPNRLTYTNTEYGIRLSAPIFEGTGPLICVTDPDHARKTARNQPQYGTHTASIGSSSIVNCSLVELQSIPSAGIMQRDVVNTDKQDDGAARRLFHSQALEAMVTKSDEGNMSVKPGFNGLFAYLSCLGLFFEAWHNRQMSHAQRVLAAFRLRFFLHLWASHIDKMAARFPDLYSRSRSFISSQSFNILNLACDSLVLLVLAHAEHYPTTPFCPWMFGTPFVEHFFGLARMMLPNFTYAEFLEMVKHVMVRQTILLSGKFADRREKDSAVGYSLDYDASKLSANDLKRLTQLPTRSDLDHLASLAAQEATAMCKSLVHITPLPLPWHLTPVTAPKQSRTSKAKPSTESDEDDASGTSENEQMEDEDEENDELAMNSVDPNSTDLSTITATAALDTARYSALCTDLDIALAEVAVSQPTPAVQSSPSDLVETSTTATSISATPKQLQSQILDAGKLSISRLVAFRKSMQSGTHVRSERVVTIDPKFEIARLHKDNLPTAYSMKPSEASHRVRIAQDLDPTILKPKTARQLRWQSKADALALVLPRPQLLPHLNNKNVTAEHPLQAGCFVIMQTKLRTYVGEVRELYMRGESKRHNGVLQVTSLGTLSNLSLVVYLPVTRSDEDQDETTDGGKTEFSCMFGKSRLSTHAPAGQLLYNLGREQLVDKHLTTLAQSRWDLFMGVTVPAFKKILIPGGQMKKK